MAELATYRTVLEEFFAQGLHALLSGFVSDNMERFEPPNPDAPDEQSHTNYELFQQFSALVEEKLGTLLAERGLSSEALWEAVQELHASGETDLKDHCDFLLASTEYKNFVALFAQYRSLGATAPGSPVCVLLLLPAAVRPSASWHRPTS